MDDDADHAGWLIRGRHLGAAGRDPEPHVVDAPGEGVRGRIVDKAAPGDERKAREPFIGRDMTVAQAFAAIVEECIRQFRVNQPLIVAERDPDALHQARVAMRRLRTAFTLFRPAIRKASLEPLKAALRDLLKPFGTARNLDVFLSHHGKELGWRDRRELEAARSECYDQLADVLNAPRTQALIGEILNWSASDEWREEGAAHPVGAFAAERLDRAWKRVKRNGSSLRELPEKRLHRLRIDIKELRYSVEFLAPLCRPKRARNYASSLEAMQDCLGLMHDGMISRQMVAEYGLGHQVECEPKARARQLKKLDARFKHLKKAGPYWR